MLLLLKDKIFKNSSTLTPSEVIQNYLKIINLQLGSVFTSLTSSFIQSHSDFLAANNYFVIMNEFMKKCIAGLISSSYIYEGQFANGEASGLGRTLKSFSTFLCLYEGKLLSGSPHGLGCRYTLLKPSLFPSEIYIGYFDSGNYTSSGRLLELAPDHPPFKAGSFRYYCGEFVNGEKDGVGVEATGEEVYEGRFWKGQRAGKGVVKAGETWGEEIVGYDRGVLVAAGRYEEMRASELDGQMVLMSWQRMDNEMPQKFMEKDWDEKIKRFQKDMEKIGYQSMVGQWDVRTQNIEIMTNTKLSSLDNKGQIVAKLMFFYYNISDKAHKKKSPRT